MVELDTFSKREKEEVGQQSDIYIYDNLPASFRIQIGNLILNLATELSNYDTYKCVLFLSNIVDDLRHEFGVKELEKEDNCYDALDELRSFIYIAQNVVQVLFAIEHTFKSFKSLKMAKKQAEFDMCIASNIEELNNRFKQYRVGYRFENDKLIRIDNTFLHEETVKPALNLLTDPMYEVAQGEFFDAYEHFRYSKNKEAIESACKSLESVMKIICKKRGWEFKEADSAKKLIEICFINNLIDTIMKDYWNGLQQILLSGVPKIRNKRASHGQGDKPYVVPDYLVSYVLHMTAASIVMLVNAEKNLM